MTLILRWISKSKCYLALRSFNWSQMAISLTNISQKRSFLKGRFSYSPCRTYLLICGIYMKKVDYVKRSNR